MSTFSLVQEFNLSENGNMIFHWADFFETCDLIKTKMEKNPQLLQDFKKKEKNLQLLTKVTVWIRTEKTVYQTSMFELYENYILNQFHTYGDIDPACTLKISLISGTGPFKAMSITDCFNKNTYQDFVMLFLLQERLPRRDYRVRVQSKVLMEHGDDFEKADLVALEQITLNGLLFSMDAGFYEKNLKHLDSVRFLINSQVFSDAMRMNLDELKKHLSPFTFNLLYSSSKEDSVSVKVSDISVHSSFAYTRNKTIFLFVPYNKTTETKPGNIKAVSEFVQHTKMLVLEHFQESA